MKTLALLLALAAASPAGAATLVYLNFDGAAGVWGIKREGKGSSLMRRFPGAVPPVDVAPYLGQGKPRADAVNAMIAQVAHDFARYDVRFTAERPTARPYTEVLITSMSSGQVLHPSLGDIKGRASRDVDDKEKNDLVLVFTGTTPLGEDPRETARTISHELAHSFGAAHTTGAVAAAVPADILCMEGPCLETGYRWEFKDANMDVEDESWQQNTANYLRLTLGARR